MWARSLISKANHKQDINAGELRATLAAQRVDLAPRVVLLSLFFLCDEKALVLFSCQSSWQIHFIRRKSFRIHGLCNFLSCDFECFWLGMKLPINAVLPCCKLIIGWLKLGIELAFQMRKNSCSREIAGKVVGWQMQRLFITWLNWIKETLELHIIVPLWMTNLFLGNFLLDHRPPSLGCFWLYHSAVWNLYVSIGGLWHSFRWLLSRAVLIPMIVSLISWSL